MIITMKSRECFHYEHDEFQSIREQLQQQFRNHSAAARGRVTLAAEPVRIHRV
ncbi:MULTISPECIES: hypothetical protein [Methylobacterium]|uniref:hypothetical protein n=1 Tax=Methylobacterium TaxID=407 RepID=UPI00165024A6|nr:MULTISPECIES: hypothetical protein [Methylobacterium]